jgi:hypothetical protein
MGIRFDIFTVTECNEVKREDIIANMLVTVRILNIFLLCKS